MSKILEATCIASVVKYDGKVIPGAIVLSAGVASSDGLAIIEEGRVVYITSNATDINLTLGHVSTNLEKMSQVLNKIALTLGTIGAKMTGPTTSPPPTLPADMAEIVATATQLTALKVQVDLLKDNLK